MTTDRRQRLARLVKLQERLKELHEARRAAHLKEAAAAEAEAAELAGRLDAPDSLAALFPALYHDRIARALARREKSLARAAEEATMVAAAGARADVAERAHTSAVRSHERAAEEKAVLEMLEHQRER
ncbi:hypothetical protein [Chelativorans salis]|uniref:Flagellar export protein FliJ n=1 Tax=Chelativorans salis TaxID=2978478 RepID=A0ABT2LSM9_9HYPH|nr:hypothetical protein [Chelativorans sp. EGI FJ00035]MCT7377552.1 hypothetical protein [Chelativorans sp. EGI FJ00035]